MKPQAEVYDLAAPIVEAWINEGYYKTLLVYTQADVPDIPIGCYVRVLIIRGDTAGIFKQGRTDTTNDELYRDALQRIAGYVADNPLARVFHRYILQIALDALGITESEGE